MRSLRFALIAASLVASTAFASPTAPTNGVEYVTLAQPQPVQASGKKVEVIEFFMYHCPHCNALEPMFEQWVKKQGDNIVLRRIHIPAGGPADPEAHLYLTLEAMGKVDQMHAKVFKAIHVDRVRLNRDDTIIDWAAKNGLDRKAFTDAWNSFGVTTKLRRLQQLTTDYKVDGAPTIVIDGKYQTSPAQVYNSTKSGNEQQLFQETLQVMDALVAKAAKTK
ncbi:thiol:disulfide interchange protein DsbA/DsbL [Massilia sp. TN1-12]|uniref:thiol:disulfide interchange protein DsbA/DsbL n=1 Tax=Massilia paldalensis TaxID=3377675 RepID=UPI0038507ECB